MLAAAFFSETIEEYFAPAQGRAFILRYFDFLEQAAPGGGSTSLVAAIRNYVARNAQRGLVILISDMMTEDAYRGITAIQEAGNELVLLHVLDWGEIDPVLSGELSLVTERPAGPSTFRQMPRRSTNTASTCWAGQTSLKHFAGGAMRATCGWRPLGRWRKSCSSGCCGGWFCELAGPSGSRVGGARGAGLALLHSASA